MADVKPKRDKASDTPDIGDVVRVKIIGFKSPVDLNLPGVHGFTHIRAHVPIHDKIVLTNLRAAGAELEPVYAPAE